MESQDWQAGMDEVVRSFDQAHPYGVGYASLETGDRMCVAIASTCEQRARALVGSKDPSCATVVVVDNRGAHLEAELVTLNLAYDAEARAALTQSGSALPDGTFPMVTVDDLQLAVSAVDSASDPVAVRAHIEAKAQELGVQLAW